MELNPPVLVHFLDGDAMPTPLPVVGHTFFPDEVSPT